MRALRATGHYPSTVKFTSATSSLLLQAFGVLEEDNYVAWTIRGKPFRKQFSFGEFCFCYGTPELGRNLVWKPIDTDPSLCLNFYHKSKEFMQSVVVVLRYIN